MKPKTSLQLFLTLAGSSIFAVTSVSAQTIYTWTQKTTGSQSWTAEANWLGGTTNDIFQSGSANELRLFADTSTSNQPAASANIVVTDIPATLSMNTLTLNGRGPNNTAGAFITVGTSASTWTLGDLTTSTVNLSNITGSGSGFGDRDLRYTIAANLILTGDAGGITTFNGASNSITGANFSGNITETAAGKGITKSGRSLLVFSGNNSYTGTTSVTGGTLRLSHANALSGGIGTTGGTSALTITGGVDSATASVLELGATDFSRGLGTGSSQFQITGGFSGFSAFGGPRKVTVNGDASQELQWGSAYFAPTTLILNTIHANNSIELANKVDLNGATRTVEVNADKALISGDIRTTSGTAGLTKTGNGTLVLTGNNTYNGDTTISAGTLSLASASNIGGSGTSNLIMSGGSLQIRGTALTSLSGLDSTVTFSNTAKGFDIHNAANTFTVDQVISGTGTGSTLTKSGAGTLVLNRDNTYAGATTVSGGGTLVLDYTNNNGSKLSDAALTLSGSTIELKGGSHGEVVNNTVMSQYYTNSITRSSGTAVIHLNTITGNNNRNALSLSEGGIATTDTLNNATTGILGGWATVGSHLAINSTNTADGLITAYSGYTDFVSSGSSSTTNYQLQGSGSVTANQAMNTLRIENAANDQVLDIGATTLTIANYNGGNGGGVLLYAGGANNNYTITGTGALSPTNINGQSLGINVYEGTLTLDVRIANTGSNFVKTGAGTLIMNKATSAAGGGHTGAAYLLQGATRMADALALGTGSVTVNAGAALELSNGIAVGAKALSLDGVGVSNGGGLRNHSGSNSYAGAITIGASGARINSDTSSSLSLTGGVVTALTQDITFGGAGNTTVSSTAISGGGGLIKDGAGVLTLSATNTYTGTTMVSAGKLVVNGSIANSSLTTVASGATVGGSGTLGALTISSGGFIAPGNSPGSLTVNGDYVQAGSYTTEINGLIAGTQHDQINVTGTVNITGGSLTTLFTGSYTANDLIFILLNDSSDAITGIYSGLAQGSTVTTYGGFNWNISYLADSAGGTFTGGNDIALQAAVIPEPNVAALIGLAGLGLLLRRRRC